MTLTIGTLTKTQMQKGNVGYAVNGEVWLEFAKDQPPLEKLLNKSVRIAIEEAAPLRKSLKHG